MFDAIFTRLLNSRLCCAGILLSLVTCFWWPALSRGEVIVHGDAAHHGLSLITMLHNWMTGKLDSLLWSTGIYGGHPLFAEGQGGFLTPINVLGALLFEPVRAFGVVHWANMLAAGAGAYTLCRILNIDRWSSLFGAIALSFSAVWLVCQSNLTVSGTLVWMTWTMVAVQFWLKSLSLGRAVTIAIPAALMMLAGYPHLAYGLLVYFACFAIAWVLTKDGREFLSGNYRKLILHSAVVGVLALGLSAVQLLPLIELVQFSHRSEGINLAVGGYGLRTHLSSVFFFSWYDWPGAPGGIFGILAALSFAVLAAFMRLPHQIVGHFLGAILLLNLGLGHASPIFALIYEHNLIPGLRSFRIMTPFLAVGCVGLSVLAAYAISTLAKGDRTYFRRFLQLLPVPGNAGPALVVFTACLVCSYYFFLPETSVLNYVFALACLGSVLVLLVCNRSQYVPPIAVVWLVAEIVVLRNGIYDFYDASVLAEPETVQLIKQDADHNDYNAYSMNSRVGFVFLRPRHPRLDIAYSRYLSSLAPFPALTWGIPSLDGALALNLRRHALLSGQLQLESTGDTALPAGSRAIDLLGVRYFTFNKRVSVPGFQLMLEVPGNRLRLYRNEYAKPKVQTYPGAVAVADPEEALAEMRAAPGPVLFVETPALPPVNESSCPGFESSVALTSVVKSSQRYSAVVESECPGWLFIRDAYYPGWHALRDGEPVPLYPAQVLGKAVPFPAGSSRIDVVYHPRSFYLGAGISCLALAVLFGIIIRSRFGRPG